MILQDLLESFFLPTTKICLITPDRIVLYRGRVDKLLRPNWLDPAINNALKSNVRRVTNGSDKFIDIYCDEYMEPLTREKIMETFAKYDGGRFKNDCE